MAHSTQKLVTRTLATVLTLASVLGTAPATKASGAYDGNWNVVIRGSGGECKGAFLPVKINNGSVAHSGPSSVSVSGTVGDNGAVSVSVSNNSGSANGSGHLAGNSGSGTWSGGPCSGTWSAFRRA
jgi:hypothetical protein